MTARLRFPPRCAPFSPASFLLFLNRVDYNFSIFLFKSMDAGFYHLFQFFIFGPSIIRGNISKLIQKFFWNSKRKTNHIIFRHILYITSVTNY